MRLKIIGVKPDKGCAWMQGGNEIKCRSSIAITRHGDILPLETINEELTCDTFDMEAVKWLADKTDTELYAVVAILVPKRRDGVGWADPFTYEQIDDMPTRRTNYTGGD